MRESGLLRKWAIAVSVVAVLAVAVALAMRPREDRGQPSVAPSRPPNAPTSAPTAAAPPDTAHGLSCIRGGTSRDEVRRIMGEPDSIAFGDWLYGRSSVTFGYGVVLDYANRDGRLRLCP